MVYAPAEHPASSPPLRGLVFAKYGDRAASTRQRFVQHAPHLAAANITLDIHPLFDNAYLEGLFITGKRNRVATLHAYAKRAADLLKRHRVDFIVVQYELFPYLPGVLERLIALSGKPLIYDIDDAIFHQYDTHRTPWVRALLARKLEPLLTRADLALCGNAYLAEYISRFSKRTEIVPTVVDTSLYAPAAQQSSSVTLGWIGSPSTWDYCQPLVDTVRGLITEKELSFLVIGAEHKADNTLPFTFRMWEEVREIADIQAMDIGIMPIPDEPWARGKCGYKLIQYMACGLPVIASPVGVNCEIVTDGENGFLASTPEQWRKAICTLANDAELRKHMGEAGRARAIERYSLAVHGPRVAQLLRTLSNQL